MSTTKITFRSRKACKISSSMLLCISVLLPLIAECECRLTLSPSGVVWVCPGATLAISCGIDGSFLYWSVSIFPSAVTRSRLIISGSLTVEPLIFDTDMVNIPRTFNISITSTMDELTSALSIVDVAADLNGTEVNCIGFGTSLGERDTSTAIIYVAKTDTANSNPLNVTEVPKFGVTDIIVTLLYQSWTHQEISISYNVSIVPQVALTSEFNQGSGRVTVTVAYNTPYIVSIVAFLCGQHVSNTITRLNYVKCENLNQLGLEDHSVQINVFNTSDPALVGVNVTLECSSPNLVLTGLNATTCKGNGEWEPDPREVRCVADCGVPLVDSSLNLTYNSTLEGSEVLVWCDGFVVTALCHGDGSWSPQITDSVCNFIISPVITESEAITVTGSTTVPNYNVIITVIVVIFFMIFLTFNCVVVFICFYLKYKQLPKTSDGKMGDTLSNQPTQPLYETVMGCTTADLEMSENVAYAPVRSTK